MLYDANCQKGIAPHFPQKFEEEKQLENACIDIKGTSAKVNSATWLGVFRYHPNSVPAWTLEVRSMRVLAFTCEYSFFYRDVPIRLPEPPFPTWPPGK